MKHDEPQAPVSCPSGVPRIRCALLGSAYAALITLTRLASGYKYLLFDCPKSRWHFNRHWLKVWGVFLLLENQARRPTVREHPCTCYTRLTRLDRQWERLQRVFTLRISGAPPESSFPFKARRPNSGWTLLYVVYLKSIWRFDRQWERLQRVFTLRISGAPPESSFPLKARRPNSGWTLLYAFYA